MAPVARLWIATDGDAASAGGDDDAAANARCDVFPGQQLDVRWALPSDLGSRCSLIVLSNQGPIRASRPLAAAESVTRVDGPVQQLRQTHLCSLRQTCSTALSEAQAFRRPQALGPIELSCLWV